MYVVSPHHHGIDIHCRSFRSRILCLPLVASQPWYSRRCSTYTLFRDATWCCSLLCEELQIDNLYDNTLSKERKERKALKTAQVLASLYKFNLLVYTTLPTSKASLIHVVGCSGFHGIIEPQYIIRIKISLCSIEFQPCHVMCHIRVIDATLFLAAVYF